MMSNRHANTGIEAFTAIASGYESWFTTPQGAIVDGLEKQALARILDALSARQSWKLARELAIWLNG